MGFNVRGAEEALTEANPKKQHGSPSPVIIPPPLTAAAPIAEAWFHKIASPGFLGAAKDFGPCETVGRFRRRNFGEIRGNLGGKRENFACGAHFSACGSRWEPCGFDLIEAGSTPPLLRVPDR